MSLMSNFRSMLPDSINNPVMYGIGNLRCFIQPYISTEFTASQIENNLYVGDLASASNRDALNENGITHIVCVFNGGVEMYPESFDYKVIHINDDHWVDIGEYFDESNEYIDQALSVEDNKVMVHCQRGVSRSVTLVAAYILYKMNSNKVIHYNDIDETITNVLSLITEKREIAKPNDGFVECLRNYLIRINTPQVSPKTSPESSPEPSEIEVENNQDNEVENIQDVIGNNIYNALNMLDDQSQSTETLSIESNEISTTSVSSNTSSTIDLD